MVNWRLVTWLLLRCMLCPFKDISFSIGMKALPSFSIYILSQILTQKSRTILVLLAKKIPRVPNFSRLDIAYPGNYSHAYTTTTNVSGPCPPRVDTQLTSSSRLENHLWWLGAYSVVCRDLIADLASSSWQAYLAPRQSSGQPLQQTWHTALMLGSFCLLPGEVVCLQQSLLLT